MFASSTSTLCSMVDMRLPRYDLVKTNRYVNSTYIQTSRGCHQACTFCAEPLLNGLKFRYRPVDEVMREVEQCGQRYISLNDADFFGTTERPKELMRALKGRGVRWQAGVTSRLALKDEMLELAAESGCYMMSIGFESISRETLRSVHKHVNHPDMFRELVQKIHSYGIMVFGLFMFGFDHDDPSVFEETVKFNIDADYDMCAYSALTPYPGTLTWYQMQKEKRIVSYDWDKYDQGHIVYRPGKLTPDQLRDGHMHAYRRFYSWPSILRRFPLTSSRNRRRPPRPQRICPVHRSCPSSPSGETRFWKVRRRARTIPSLRPWSGHQHRNSSPRPSRRGSAPARQRARPRAR